MHFQKSVYQLMDTICMYHYNKIKKQYRFIIDPFYTAQFAINKLRN